MPRQADPELEQRILNEAHKLWSQGGEQALSMRVLARRARTNTPAVYRRFRNRKAILRALVQRARQELRAKLEACTSLQEVAHRVLEFALSRQREYQLLTSGLIASVSETRPNFEFVLERSAQWLGGSPKDHVSLVLALWALIHGTASLLISKTVAPEHIKQMHSAFSAAVQTLLRESKIHA
ncbi:MAG TPA: TetR/AcrR family transcriptional regulator [Candidatus Sulfotelmatobacter sp.]|nr:TetR/AcrR family transcriptional regulator [Candidatus Sulfotelmatobacter sp.]